MMTHKLNRTPYNDLDNPRATEVAFHPCLSVSLALALCETRRIACAIKSTLLVIFGPSSVALRVF